MDEERQEWLAFRSAQWRWFAPLATSLAVLCLGLIVFDSIAVSQIWMLAPLIGLAMVSLTIAARTWGWLLVFATITLFFPAVLALQGVNW